MTVSRHFKQTVDTGCTKRRSSVRIKKEVSLTFDDEITKFDNDNQLKRRKKVIKHIKLESDKLNPPESFWPMYNEMKKMRQIIKTPVDVFGCIRIPTILQSITDDYKSTGIINQLSVEDIKELKDKGDSLKGSAIREFDSNVKTTRDYRFQLFVSLLFSSQTKDEVNFQVMQKLQKEYLPLYPNGLCVEAIINTEATDLDALINPIGFHRRKTEYLKLAADKIIKDFGGDIPDTLEELMEFKGIGHKMGILIMMGAWGKIMGISVDTHMARMCDLYDWVPNGKKDPELVRKCLEEMLRDHKEIWSEINPVLVGFGQSVCTPVNRRCDLCWLRDSKFNESNFKCPAVDERLLLRVERGTDGERKIRGDLNALIEMAPARKERKKLNDIL